MYTCRICFDETENRDEIISPCNCKGSSKYIHKDCINQWFKMNLSNANYERCNTCLFKYNRKSIDNISMNEQIDSDFFYNILKIITLSFLLFFFITLIVTIYPGFGNFIIVVFIWIIWLSLIIIEVGWVGLIIFLILSTSFHNIYQDKVKTKSLSILLIVLIFSFYCSYPCIYEYSIASVKSKFRSNNTFLMYDKELKEYVSGLL